MAIGFATGYGWRSAPSDWHQLIRATPGAIRVAFDGLHFVVPPHHALWVPQGIAHDVIMSGRGILQRVYVQPRAGRMLGTEPQVVVVTPLLRELLRRIHRLGTLDRAIATHRRLMDLVFEECHGASGHPVSLPWPNDPRAVRAAMHLCADPGSPLSQAALGRIAHASTRTLERLFQAETGLSLGRWRQRARVMHAMTLLAEGRSVTATGLAVGYASTSAFVAAFRQATGITPGRCFPAMAHSRTVPSATGGI